MTRNPRLMSIYGSYRGNTAFTSARERTCIPIPVSALPLLPVPVTLLPRPGGPTPPDLISTFPISSLTPDPIVPTTPSSPLPLLIPGPDRVATGVPVPVLAPKRDCDFDSADKPSPTDDDCGGGSDSMSIDDVEDNTDEIDEVDVEGISDGTDSDDDAVDVEAIGDGTDEDGDLCPIHIVSHLPT